MDRDKFLNEVVFGWIKRDFERMITELPVRPREAGNINFFLALCVLTTMEFLGGFLLGKNRKFEKNVEVYIDKCFSNSEEYPIGILQDIFRNGLAHEFFPRGAVSRDNEHPAIFKDDKIGIVLDAETLSKDFLNSLDNFREQLDDKKYNSRMEQLKETIKKWQDKHKKIIDDLPKKTTLSISNSSSSVASDSNDSYPKITTPP
ncbi:unnamed protein product, partial [marine sediment metagenome]